MDRRDEDISGGDVHVANAEDADSIAIGGERQAIGEKNVPQEGHKDTQAAHVHALVDSLGDGTENPVGPVDDVEYVMDQIETMTAEEARDIITIMLLEHEHDYNFSSHLRAQLMALLGHTEKDDSVWEAEIKTAAALNKYYSPYPEVRAVTTPHDNPSIPCETLRAHLIGLVWAVVGQFTNNLFLSRFPNINLTSAVVQILIYPCGLFFAWAIPRSWALYVPLPGGSQILRWYRVALNPGPWTYKEQMLSTIIMNAGINSAYCFYNIQTQVIYYHDGWLTPEYSILLLLSTQLLGLGFSGILRRFVIYPVEALWPALLPTVALNKALLLPEPQREKVHGWSLTRYQTFFIFFGAMFVYFWLPGYLFPALSTFAWMTWIAPNNFNLNIITGNAQLGWNPITSFDWNVIVALGSPLALPLFAYVQQYAGQVLSGLILIAIYWTNKSWTAYLPINSPGIFDNTGQQYDVSRVIDPERAVVIESEYQAYSPAFYTAGGLINYGATFVLFPVTIVFVLLEAWRPLLRATKGMLRAAMSAVKNVVNGTGRCVAALARGRVREAGRHAYEMFTQDDSIYDGFDNPLTELMRQYPEVPDWWFFSIALIAFVFAIIVIVSYPQVQAPVWTIFFVIGLNLTFLIPLSYINAISGIGIGVNVLTELIIGYALPGRPEAMMFGKAYGYNIDGQADTYISDQKLGFYAKVPPRAMYRGQILSTIVTTLVSYGVVTFVDNNIAGICTPDQRSKFNCEAGSQIFFSSSVIWGAIGPKRVFEQLYPALKYCFLLGFLLALVWWAVKRYGAKCREKLRQRLPYVVFAPLNGLVFKPISLLKNVHPVIVLYGASSWAPVNLSYATEGVYLSIAFMYYLRRYKTAWWEKYTYTISAALSGGVAFSAVIIFFAVQWNPMTVSWWGTNIVLGQTIDTGMGQQRLLAIPESGTFGPDTWY